MPIRTVCDDVGHCRLDRELRSARSIATARRNTADAESSSTSSRKWLIATLMAAATLVIFVAVVHRYASGVADARACRTDAQAQL